MYVEDGSYYVDLYDVVKGEERPRFEISEFLYDTLLATDKEKDYVLTNGHTAQLLDGEYIFKKTTKGYSSSTKSTSTMLKGGSIIASKSTILKRIIGNSFNFRNVRMSGIMHFIYGLIKDRESKKLNEEDYIAIAERFNFGTYYQDISSKTRTSYLAINNQIDVDYFKKNYCDIELM